MIFVVIVSFAFSEWAELQEEGADLSRKIEDGFGRDGLGIVVVSGVRVPWSCFWVLENPF